MPRSRRNSSKNSLKIKIRLLADSSDDDSQSVFFEQSPVKKSRRKSTKSSPKNGSKKPRRKSKSSPKFGRKSNKQPARSFDAPPSQEEVYFWSDKEAMCPEGFNWNQSATGFDLFGRDPFSIEHTENEYCARDDDDDYPDVFHGSIKVADFKNTYFGNPDKTRNLPIKVKKVDGYPEHMTDDNENFLLFKSLRFDKMYRQYADPNGDCMFISIAMCLNQDPERIRTNNLISVHDLRKRIAVRIWASPKFAKFYAEKADLFMTADGLDIYGSHTAMDTKTLIQKVLSPDYYGNALDIAMLEHDPSLNVSIISINGDYDPMHSPKLFMNIPRKFNAPNRKMIFLRHQHEHFDPIFMKTSSGKNQYLFDYDYDALYTIPKEESEELRRKMRKAK